MKAVTVLHKQMRVARFNKNLASANAKHDLLLDDPAKRQQHRISSKSKDNVYRFRGNVITSETERKEALNYIESLYENDDVQFDSTTLRKTKHKLKKWLDNPKTTGHEKALFNALIEATEGKKRNSLKADVAVKRLEKCGKISRFNDKKRAIQTLCDLHNQRREIGLDGDTKLNTATVNVLMKIPKHNGQVLTGEEQEKLMMDYYNHHFPNHEIVLSVIHKDEVVHHVHLTIDGKNSKTGKYDFVQTQYENVRKNHALPYPQKYSDLTPEQVQHVGELFQSDFYDYINQRQKRALFSKKEYHSEQHKRLDRQTIKLDTNKRIADREYNTANYLAQQKNKLSNDLEGLVQTSQMLLNKNKNLTDETKELTSQKDVLEKTVGELIQDAMQSAVAFAADALQTPLTVLKERLTRLHDIHPKIASEVSEHAETLQIEPEKKQAVRETYQQAIKRPKP